MIATEVISMLRTEGKGIEITSLFSHSDKDKAQSLAKANRIARVYTDYTQLLKEDDADFVYIALVNSAHYDYVRQALEADRNVIVEKPFTTSLSQAEELASLARSRNLYLFEAVSLLHTPLCSATSHSIQADLNATCKAT